MFIPESRVDKKLLDIVNKLFLPQVNFPANNLNLKKLRFHGAHLNKHTPMFINFWIFFQGLWGSITYLKDFYFIT